MTNYDLTKQRAAAQFLDYSQERIIKRWGLAYDEQSLFLRFVDHDYQISRSTGEIMRLEPAESSADPAAPSAKLASFNEAMTIYDLLCHRSETARLSGDMTPLNCLAKAQSAWMSEPHIFFKRQSKLVDANPELAISNLECMGAQKSIGADIAYIIPVFKDIRASFKFWHSDDEFAASIKTYWDNNLTDFMYYETVCYAGSYIIWRITEGME